MDGIDLSGIGNLLNAALAHQVTQFGIAFSIAAWIHSGRLKKEIKNQMGDVVAAVDNVASVLRQDLIEQGSRIGNIESGLGKLSSRVDYLENTKTLKGE